MKDISTLYSAIKGLNLFVYAPGIVQLFPKIPAWVGKIFPTYYVISPIMILTRKGGSWAEVRNDLIILIGFIILFVGLIVCIAKRTHQQKD
jgi:ABC-2 type transport system permease protein